MPVTVDPKSVCHCVSVCHGDGFATVQCHRVPHAAQPPATRPWNSPQRDAWSDELERGHTAQLSPASALPGSRSCRARELVGLWSLSFPGPCRGAHSAEACLLRCDLLVFLASLSCQGLVFLE